jgi:hypothetical protein
MKYDHLKAPQDYIREQQESETERSDDPCEHCGCTDFYSYGMICVGCERRKPSYNEDHDCHLGPEDSCDCQEKDKK